MKYFSVRQVKYVATAIVLLTTSISVCAKTAHIDSCGGEELDYNSAKKACKSGDFPGETIVTCKNNGKEKDRRVCNSDGEKNAIYLGSCGGEIVDFNTLNKACDSGNYSGELLVRCKRGRESKHKQCPGDLAEAPHTLLHIQGSTLANAASAVRTAFPFMKDAQKSKDPKFIDSHLKSLGTGHRELTGFGITMVAHEGGGPSPAADKILQWQGNLDQPNLLMFEKVSGKPKKNWPIIGMSYSRNHNTAGVENMLSVDARNYPFLVHEAGYHGLFNGGFDCAQNGDLKLSAWNNGVRVDPEGQTPIARSDLKLKSGKVRHGRIWTLHIWFHPDSGLPAVAATDPWFRQGDKARAVGHCAFYYANPQP